MKRPQFHVTVGMKEAAISLVEPKTLVKGWKAGEENKQLKSLSLGPVTGKDKWFRTLPQSVILSPVFVF